jgi:nickel transport system substrate-binding protein
MLKKRVKVVMLCCIAALSMCILVGCTKGDKDNKADTLVMSYPADTGNLNPHTYDSPMWIQSSVYEGLTRYVDNKVVPGIAESWDVSDDALEYTFHLRKGNVFSDGTPVNAEIVKKNFDAVLLYKDEHNWMESINQMKEVIAVDEYTVKIVLEKPFSSLLQELAFARPLRIGAAAMFPESGDTAEGIKEPIGSGRWIQKEHVEGQYTTFERNDKYWGEKPSYKYLKVCVMPDINTAVNSLKAGEIDLLYDIEGQMTGDTFNSLKDGFKTVQSDPISTFNFLLNTNRGATRDLDVRLALEYAIDKEDIAKNVFYGLQTVADTLYLSIEKSPIF